MMNMTKAFATNLNNLYAVYGIAGEWAEDMEKELPRKGRNDPVKVEEHIRKRALEHGFRITKKEYKELWAI